MVALRVKGVKMLFKSVPKTVHVSALTWTVHRMSKSSGYNTDSHNWLLPHSSQYLHHGTCVENAMKYNWWAMFAGDQTAVKITEVHNLLH